jgi:amidase
MSAAAKMTGKAGAPVVALPTGESDPAGVPFGVTFVAAHGDDQKLIDVCTALATLVGKRIIPKLPKF